MILGLTGRMGAGKDTVYQRLAALYPHVTQVSYAAKLKQSVAALFGISLEDIERWKNQPWMEVCVEDRIDPNHIVTMSFREMLQRYGTEAHRDVFGQDFWLDAALPLGGVYPHDEIFVVTDVRFDNEVKRVKGLGGKIIQVIGTLDNAAVGHASESVPVYRDYLIDNVIRNDGYEALDYQLQCLVEHIDPSTAA